MHKINANIPKQAECLVNSDLTNAMIYVVIPLTSQKVILI